MDSLTVLDFEHARDVATQCLFRANALIRSACREPETYHSAGNTLVVSRLAADVVVYCDFLEAWRWAIGKIQPYTQLVATEPVRHAGLCYATAHDLGWAFAHNVWLGAANVVSTALVMAERSKEWTATATFSLDRGLVDQHLCEIRDRLRDKETMDALYFGALIRIESQKAAAAFKLELDSSPEDLRDYVPADTLKLDHGIPASRLSEGKRSNNIRSVRAPAGMRDSNGRIVRVLYHRPDAVRHCTA